MGKTVSKVLRHQAAQLYEMYKDKFSTEFDRNKNALKELGIYQSKVNRDIVAGILCKLAKPKGE